MHLFLIVFYVIVGTQLVYFFVFLVGVLLRRERVKPQPLPVTVIVCAHDEEDNLRALIPLLLAQDHIAFEVIIVDDRSNDDTFDFLLAETAKDHRLRMVHVNRTPPHVNSKKFALTLGIKAARYEWILLTDADCRPKGNSWISSMSSFFIPGTEFVLGYSPYLKGRGLLNAFIRFETLLTGIQYISFTKLGIPFMGIGRNMAYRRSTFLASKGFNAILPVTGGDDDLYVNKYGRRRNTVVCIDKDSQMNSIPKTTWASFFTQKVRHLSVGKRYRPGHRILLGLFTTTWLLIWFMGIPLCFYAPFKTEIALGLAGRAVLLIITIYVCGRKLGERSPLWLIPFLDFIYAFYYLVAGLRTLVTQKVRWKS